MVMFCACVFLVMQRVMSCSFPGEHNDHLAVAAAVSLGLLGRADRSGGGQAWWQHILQTAGQSAVPE